MQALKEKYSRPWPPPKGLDAQTAQYFQKQEQEKLRTEFEETYLRFQKNSDEMLSSNALAGYQTIRDKLIAHIELRKTDEGYVFFDIKVLHLKYGQERVLLEKVRAIVDDLDLLVRSACYDWSSFLTPQTNDVCKFWEISAIE